MVLPLGYGMLGIGILVLAAVAYLIYDYFKDKKRNAAKNNNTIEQNKNPKIEN